MKYWSFRNSVLLQCMAYHIYKVSEDAESYSPRDRAELLIQPGAQQQLCIPNSSSTTNNFLNNLSEINNGQNHLDIATSGVPTNDQVLRNRKRVSPDFQRLVVKLHYTALMD